MKWLLPVCVCVCALILSACGSGNTTTSTQRTTTKKTVTSTTPPPAAMPNTSPQNTPPQGQNTTSQTQSPTKQTTVDNTPTMPPAYVHCMRNHGVKGKLTILNKRAVAAAHACQQYLPPVEASRPPTVPLKPFRDCLAKQGVHILEPGQKPASAQKLKAAVRACHQYAPDGVSAQSVQTPG